MKPIAIAAAAISILGSAVSALAADPPAAAASLAANPVDKTREAVTAMNRDIDRIVSSKGVDEAKYITLGGARQWITVRGQDRNAPILLYLHGGPGGAVSDISYLFQRPWEDYFTVVQWDQRGFGHSSVDGAKLKGTLNLEQYVADGIGLIERLRGDYGQRKIVLMGQSWGTLVALEIAHRRPDLLYALVDIGQLVDQRGNFEETRRLMTGDAQKRGDAALEKTLSHLGPVPPATDWSAWIKWVGTVQSPMEARGYSWRNSVDPEGWGSRIVAARLVAPGLIDPPAPVDSPFPGGPEAKLREVVTSVDTWDAYKAVGTTLKIPVIIIAGAYDWQTPITLAHAYYNSLCAPYKIFAEFPNSAHVVHMEEPGRMMVTLYEDVLPAVHGDVPPHAERCAAALGDVAKPR